MKIGKTSEKDKDRRKKKKSTFETEIFNIVEKSLKAVLDKALDDILKDFK